MIGVKLSNSVKSASRLLKSKIWPILLLFDAVIAVCVIFLDGHVDPAVTAGMLRTCWVILLLCAPASAYKMRRTLVEQRYVEPRQPMGCTCAFCGSHLVGSVTATCPECGKPVEKVAPAIPDIRDELRKHRSGDIPGIVIFSLLTLAGVALGVVAHGELRGVGIIVAWMCAVGILACALELRWMRRGTNNPRER